MEVKKSTVLTGILTVGSIADAAGLEALPGLTVREHCDVVEFRADGFPDCGEATLRQMSACSVPALLTVRAPEEGGMNNLPPERRCKLLERLLPGASLVDIEIRNLRRMAEVVRTARETGVAVVASYHDFRGTPDPDRLLELRDHACAEGADIVKFATFLKGSRDLYILASLVESRGGIPISAMGMGPLGPVSRLLLARLGSTLNYGWLDRPTVPGQWQASRLRALIRELAGIGSAPAGNPQVAPA